ncbi:GIR2 [Candida oxycetoniae]|uniref:GIR2 n=1 Tax=Candida oxycetoniae TaxID=497107 RepID=A0AAI9T0V5_9ASCO|nr:GIR2 [Candida oxycetoniae]KAI3406529.2 GIR2 [Candida oxycetoniae]
MDPVEEQAQEIEILQSIYPDELEFLNDSQTQFQIRVDLDLQSDRKHSFYLIVKYPATYPEVTPNLSIEIAAQQGDEEEEVSQQQHANLSDGDESDEDSKNIQLALHMAETIDFTKEDLNKLLGKLNDEAQVNIGMPSIFTLVSVLKDEAECLFQQKLDFANQQFERKRKELEKIEQKKFQGTKVTKESWLEWRNKFREEMRFDKIDERKKFEMHGGRLTGKEIFERGLAGNEDDVEENEQEEKLADGVGKIAV